MTSQYHKIQYLAVYQPSVRMVVVSVWYDEEASGDDCWEHEFLPILGIEATVREGRVEHHAIISTPGYGIGRYYEAEGTHEIMEPFVCPWPAPEDPERLRVEIEKLFVKLRRKIESKEEDS